MALSETLSRDRLGRTERPAFRRTVLACETAGGSISIFNRIYELFRRDRGFEDLSLAVGRRREMVSRFTDEQVRSAARNLRGESHVVEVFALAAVIAERVLGLRMFDVQILGALALQRGDVAEMQTGEGKTLAAVPAVVWYALQGRGAHVLTTNDYLARRDAAWMGGIYEWFGLSVGHLSQNMGAAERRAAYLCDIAYATANEVGFDYLRDGLARAPDELIQRPFGFAVIDEADSILIDEARIPLVIAGGVPEDPELAERIDSLAAGLHLYVHYFVDEFGRNVQLTDAGIRRVEGALHCGSLFDERNLRILTAVQDALHAHVLLKRDVDYVVKNGSVELIDGFKGRIAQNRRWPAGLQSAIEAKERVGLKRQGRILGSITVQNLVGMYERVCGMTGTAATQADEFWKIYKLPVTVIPTCRPVIRNDLPDIVYADRRARDRALVEDIQRVHETGRPILVGTASVEESELLSRHLQMAGVTHSVLNARNDEAEAEIVAQAGALGAVTISTNMAGRGTDILLGGNPPKEREKVLALGGLYVIGTTRHEARRIDHQLRGRAGRQGDPGTSRFFLSFEDELLVRFGIAQNPDIDSVQRTAESQNLETREMLWKYESVVEHHRREVYGRRREILLSSDWSVGSLLPEEQYRELVETVGEQAVEEAGRRLALAVIDELWADYLASVAELRGGIHWVSWGGRDPLYEFLTGVQEIYEDFRECLMEDVSEAFATAEARDGQIHFQNAEQFERGATWTYLTTDQPFGTLGERAMKGLRRKFSRR
ncbi:MAG: preprotein translocase subunit SecA [Bryobacterales bacterium]|nr:preprotein translocase subunit SecA [Bryobacterales bacterium]